jgi:hypothetical protein
MARITAKIYRGYTIEANIVGAIDIIPNSGGSNCRYRLYACIQLQTNLK